MVIPHTMRADFIWGRNAMSFPIDDVRAAFPALAIQDEGRDRIYLDNPAGTQVPQSVVDAVSTCLVESNANLAGHFETSKNADRVVAAAHVAMADFLGAQSADEIIIGANMTTLTFHLSRSICRNFLPGDEIVVTRMDHEGDIAPWLEIAEDMDLKIRWVPFDTETWQVEPDVLESHLSERTKLVAINHASNLTGSINDVKALSAKAKAVGALVYVDAVQFAPHGFIDVQDLGCDFLACSSYKFFGPHMGILWGRSQIMRELHAYKCRCVPDDLPVKFETGTPQIELLAGLAATVDYFADLGQRQGANGARRDQIAAAFAGARSYEDPLALRLLAALQDIPGVKVFGITNPNRVSQRVPTVSFGHETRSPKEIAKALGDRGIFVWSGHNYALEVVRHLGIPEDVGLLRIGIAHYNTEAEIETTINALGEILE